MAGEWKQTACNFCGVGCGFEMLVEDNKVVDMRPSRYGHGDSFPEPYCCRKGRSTKYCVGWERARTAWYIRQHLSCVEFLSGREPAHRSYRRLICSLKILKCGRRRRNHGCS